MALTPIEVRKMRFSQKLRGLDPAEVEEFLSVVSDEIAAAAGRIEQLEQEVRYYQKRHQEAESREHQLQQTLLQAQKVSDEITSNAKREAQLLVQEAEINADRIVKQAVEQAGALEGRINELRVARRDIRLKLKNTVDLFQSILDAESADEGRTPASIHKLPRRSEEA